MAQTLKFGNKTWATKVGSTLAYNDENGNYKPLPFAFTRSTLATRVNKEGLIEVVTNDRPRIDYTDTSDGVLLLEKAATNSINYSEDFNQWDAIRGNISLTENAIISPDGTLNATKVFCSDNSVSDYAIFEIVTSGSKSFSLYAKKGELNYLFLGNDNSNSTNGVFFDLENGLINKNESGFDASIKDVGNDWYRCSVYFTTISYHFVCMSEDGQDFDLTNNQNNGIYIFGAQSETGNVASSYIPTQGSASTRVAETANGAGNSEVFSDSQGVLFCDIAANSDDGTYRFLSVSAGAYANSIRIGYFNTSNTIEFRVVAGGLPQTQPTHTLSNSTIPTKIAGKYKANDFSLFVNGFKVDTDTSGTTPSGLSELSFDDGNSSNNAPFYGKTKEIGYYDTILTDLELETLTSYKSWTSMVNELNLNIIYNG